MRYYFDFRCFHTLRRSAIDRCLAPDRSTQYASSLKGGGQTVGLDESGGSRACVTSAFDRPIDHRSGVIVVVGASAERRGGTFTRDRFARISGRTTIKNADRFLCADPAAVDAAAGVSVADAVAAPACCAWIDDDESTVCTRR